MDQILLFALLGLGTGAQIAAVGLGLVVTYRGAGVINLAAGAMGMVAVYIFWALRTSQFGFALGTVPAIVLSLLFMLALSVLVEAITFRPLRTASPLAKLVSTFGVLLLAQAIIELAFGVTPIQVPSVLPTSFVSVFNVPAQVASFYLTGIVIAFTIALALLYRFSRFGLATRASSESEPYALLAGLTPNRISLANTMLSNLVVGSLAICAASLSTVDPTNLPLIIVPALAAAIFGRFTSFWIVCLAGLAIGASESLLYYFSTLSWFPHDSGGQPLPGIVQLLEFLLVVIALWARASSLPRRGEFVERSLPAVPRQEHLFRRMAPPIAICAVALVVLPWDFRQAVITGLVWTILYLSLTVVTGYVGQLSVMQLSLAGVSGFALSHMATGAGLNFPVGALVAVAGATVLGVIVGFSALRVRGVSLVVVTLAAAEAIESFGFSNSDWGGGLKGAPVPSPSLFGIDLGSHAGFRGIDSQLPSPIIGFFALFVCALIYFGVVNLRRSDLGRRMLAVRSNERAAAAANINVRAVKLTAFTIGSVIAGIAGVMYAYDFGTISQSSFSAIAGLVIIANLYVVGITMPQGAVLAGFASTGALAPLILEKYILPSSNIGVITSLIAGLGLIVQLSLVPEGLLGRFWKQREGEQLVGTQPSVMPHPFKQPLPKPLMRRLGIQRQPSADLEPINSSAEERELEQVGATSQSDDDTVTR